jgi:hypothetical protein
MKEASMARPKTLPPPVADCPLCGRTVEALRLDQHERAHVIVRTDTRKSASDPYRDESDLARRHTVVYELAILRFEFEPEDALRARAETFFPHVIARLASELPRDARLHYVPFRHFTLGQYSPIVVSMLMIAHL